MARNGRWAVCSTNAVKCQSGSLVNRALKGTSVQITTHRRSSAASVPLASPLLFVLLVSLRMEPLVVFAEETFRTRTKATAAVPGRETGSVPMLYDAVMKLYNAAHCDCCYTCLILRQFSSLSKCVGVARGGSRRGARSASERLGSRATFRRRAKGRPSQFSRGHGVGWRRIGWRKRAIGWRKCAIGRR
jgi:hypothetical protein